ncbi:berberine bridge enzyme-like 8 [Cucurbita moschata]|uniref:Berberine bridge enzyme-like 8 n=1 Tax=Cucurbita moschata TaxID=3662 RepID=A0A6J1ENY7_CUCMO|nr:berberine bridge enzyme-like 8 [Cucurbita moschata]
MKTLKSSVILVLSFSFLLVFASAKTATENFVQCLLRRSPPSYPIAPAIFTPNNHSYSSVLQTYIQNLRFNTSTTPKPFLILTALHEYHVRIAILCARIDNLLMKIRSGGHDYEGVSYVSDIVPFFILDMFNLRRISIDIKTETAWVQTGATIGEVFYKIAEESKLHGFPAGVCPTMGVGGHLSGGGYGNMMRKHGLTVDQFIDAKIIDVNGKLLDRKAMGEDLFWAITGGGGSSFGVVVAYKIRLVRVPETVTVFRVRRTLEENELTEIVDEWQRVAHVIDNDLFIRVTFDVVNGTHKGNKTLRATFLAMFLGDSQTLLSLINNSFPKLGLKKPDCLEMSWIESVLFWTDETSVNALLNRMTGRIHLKRKSDYVKTLIPKKGFNKIWKKMIELEKPMMKFNPYGGRMGEIASNATPFPHRAGNLWKIQYTTNWNEEGSRQADHLIDLTRKLHKFMTPFVSKNPRTAFLNYRDLDIGVTHNGKKSYYEGRGYGIKYFEGNFERLVKIKTKVDPDNFFRNEQSIPRFPHV